MLFIRIYQKKKSDIKIKKVHEDRLLSALNKYYRPMTKREYLDEHDIPMINNAIAVAGFPKEIMDWIFEIDRKPFEVFK